jgi:ribose transport system substrate-binding protein
MKFSLKRSPRRVAVTGVLLVVAVAAFGVAAATGALEGAPPQKHVAVQNQAKIGSGKGIVIGYATSLEAVPIVHVISNGIKAQAKRAGVKLIFCDTGGDSAKALDCAKSMKTQGAQGVLQFQHVAKASPAICKAGPQGVPVFAIDIPQPPCQTSFMGVDNAYGGFVAGEKAGETAKAKWNCKYDAWVSLEEPEIGAPNEQRMGGYRKGFQSVCPGKITNLKKYGFDATADKARTIVTDALTTLPGKHRIIVSSIDDEGVEGAFAAAKAAGRPTDVYGISLGVADKVAKCGIKNNSNWLAATAIAPEKYGWVGIPYMIQAIKTGKLPSKLLYVPLRAVNSKNISQYYPHLGC